MTKDQEYKLLFESWNSYVDMQEQRSPVSKDDQAAFEKSLKKKKKSSGTPFFEVERLSDNASPNEINKALRNDLALMTKLGASPVGQVTDQLEKLICTILRNEGFFQMLTLALETEKNKEKEKINTSGSGISDSIKNLDIKNALLSALGTAVSAAGYVTISIVDSVLKCPEWPNVESRLKDEVENEKDDPKKDEKTGITISYKGKPLSHGAKNKKKCVIPGMENAKNLYPMLKQGGYFKVTPGNPEKWGNPVLADVLLAAAMKTRKKGNGVPIVNNISLEHGGPIGPSTSHQVGLDVDCSYYFKSKSIMQNADVNFNDFDLYKNIIFMYYLTQDDRVQVIYTDKTLMDKIDKKISKIFLHYSRKKEKEKLNAKTHEKHMKAWYRAKRSGKLKHEPGHDDHYHIRVKHPGNQK